MSLPVYLKVDDVPPISAYPNYTLLVESASQVPEYVLGYTWGSEESNGPLRGKVLQSSFQGCEPTTLHPERSGLLGTVMQAFGHHHHLILRPDDIWIAILTQFNFYVNAHVEELRSKFVSHSGQKQLYVEAHRGFDFRFISEDMAKEIQKHVVDKELKDWILPAFTTTTEDDKIVCAAMMMSTLKAYFLYSSGITCGIPSITLEGTEKDWLEILHRLDKLTEFGLETTAWATLLRPILEKFVDAFRGVDNRSFWKTIVNVRDQCDREDVTGWITEFAVWTEKGIWKGPALPLQPNLSKDELTNIWSKGGWAIDSMYMPVGFCDVELLLRDTGTTEYPCLLIAGHMATLVEGNARDTIRPQPGWFMTLKGKKELNEETTKRFDVFKTPEPKRRKREPRPDDWMEKVNWVAGERVGRKVDLRDDRNDERREKRSKGSLFCSISFSSVMSLFRRR